MGIGIEDTHISTATPPQAATDVAKPPTARLFSGDRRRGAAYRNGFSMNRSVRTPSPPETTTAAMNLPTRPSGWPTNIGANTSTGQCHRYHEYDNRPIARIGDHARMRPAPCDGVAQPAPSSSAVPRTGSSAALPG